MQKVVLDSDIIIDHLQDYGDTLQTLLVFASQKKLQLYIPSVVVTELFSGKETKKQERLFNLKRLLERLEWISNDKEISEVAGFLIRDYSPIKLADAIVAATALSLNAKLATRNKKDFENIKELKFFKLTK